MSGEHHHNHHHDHDEEHEHHRQGWLAYILSRETRRVTAANFRESGLPWHRTLLVASANYWRKVRGLQRCCGKPATRAADSASLAGVPGDREHSTLHPAVPSP